MAGYRFLSPTQEGIQGQDINKVQWRIKIYLPSKSTHLRNLGMLKSELYLTRFSSDLESRGTEYSWEAGLGAGFSRNGWRVLGI